VTDENEPTGGIGRGRIGSAPVGEDDVDPRPTDPPAARTLIVENTGAGAVEYRFDVDGTVEEAPASATVVGPGRVAAQSRTGWTQEYLVAGEIVRFDARPGVEWAWAE
jgi:hypothetical protein